MFMINGKSVNVELPPCRTRFARHAQPPVAACEAPEPKAQWGRPAGRAGRGTYGRRGPWRNDVVRPEPEAAAPGPSAALRRKLNEARLRLERKKRMAAGDARTRDVSVQCRMKAALAAERDVAAARHEAVQADFAPGPPWMYTWPVVRAKTGVDACTQVTRDQLTDTDAEAYRLTEFMTVALLTEAAERVLYEDDAAALRRERAAVRARLLADRAETTRLVRAEARRRRRALRALAREERETPESAYRAVHSRAMAERYAQAVAADVLDELVSAGYLVDGHRADPARLLAGSAGDRFRRRGRAGATARALIVGDAVANRARSRLDVAGSRDRAARPEDAAAAVVVVDTFPHGETGEIRSFPSTHSFESESVYKMNGSYSPVLTELNYEYEHEIEEDMYYELQEAGPDRTVDT